MQISIHSARVGGDPLVAAGLAIRGISIHSARVGGDDNGPVFSPGSKISIHSARVGGDARDWWDKSHRFYFNPLRPCGRRLDDLAHCGRCVNISIHSARVGGDGAEKARP